MSSSGFISKLWFVCTACRQVFSSDTEKLTYTIRNHSKDCKSVNLIVFEELLLNKHVNYKNVQPPNKKKKYFNHQRNQDKEQNLFANKNSELFLEIPKIEIKNPNAKPCIDASSKHIVFSSTSAVSEPSSQALPCKKYNSIIQNVEQNKIEKQLLVTTASLVLESQLSQKNQIQNIKRTTTNSALALPSPFNFANLNKPEVNNDESDERLLKTVNSEPTTVTQVIPILNASEINGDRIRSNGIIKNTPSHLEFNSNLNQEAISICSIPIPSTSSNSSTSNNSNFLRPTDSITETVETSKWKAPLLNIQAESNNSKIIYSESDIPSDCNLEVNTFEDHQGHQRSCFKHNLDGFIINRNSVTSLSQRNINNEVLIPSRDSDDISDELYASIKSLNINSHKDNIISSCTNSSKVSKIAKNVTDSEDVTNCATALENEGISESKSDDDNRKSVATVVPGLKLPKTLTPTATARHHPKQAQKATKQNLALFEWLKTQKQTRFSDGTKNHINLGTYKFVTYKPLGAKNHIVCTLCKTKLVSELHLINHVKNCWLHNQSNHRYCIPCGKHFSHPNRLANHFQSTIYRVKHDPFRRKNGQHILDPLVDQEGKDEDQQRQTNEPDLFPTVPVPIAIDNDLPILKWLEMQDKSPHNVVALDPDPFSKTNISKTPRFTVSESSPIKCQLCQTFLTSYILLRNHVKTCWLENKAKHCYCVPCKMEFKSASILRLHQKRNHNTSYWLDQKQNQKSYCWSCTVCYKVMENEMLFNAHQGSLQIFLGKSLQVEKEYEEMLTHVNPTQPPHDIAGQKGTMDNLSTWLKHARKLTNADGTFLHLILVDPEPSSTSPSSSAELGSSGSDGLAASVEINKDNPITCRLCLKTLTQFYDVKSHVTMCWNQNKEKHCYCVFCEKGFPTPMELQEHRTCEHSAPENIVLFYRGRGSDGDQLINVDDLLEVNSENPVTCKLCEAELENTLQAKIHSENCWLHNKTRHVYCTICNRRFDNSQKFSWHNRIRHRTPHKGRSLAMKCTGMTENEVTTDKLLPLRQWLKKLQKENPNNFIALEPDPATCETIISESSPVECKLCKKLLTTESRLRNHVKTCWIYNREKHRYCVTCNQLFKSNHRLVVHQKAKHPPRRLLPLLNCLKCNHEFLTKSELTKHTESLQEFQLQVKNYTIMPPAQKVTNSVVDRVHGSANTMSFLFESLKNLRKQVESLDFRDNIIILIDPEPASDNFDEISPENPITCRLCLQKFTTARTLKSHVQNCWTANKEMHVLCVTCDKVFETPQHLQDHARVEHSELAEGSCTCIFCSQEFCDAQTFQDHKDALKDLSFRPFKCPHCSIQFMSQKSFSKHTAALQQGCRKVPAVKCKTCSKSFTDRYALNDHNRAAHEGDIIKCIIPTCGYFCSSAALRQHHYHSKHSEELIEELKEFPCLKCGKVYKQRGILNRHIKLSHTQEKPHKCTHNGCEKAYKKRLQLVEHERVHTGETPHQCEECGKTFARLWTFLKHRRSHEGTINQAHCHLCPRKFQGGWELKEHLLKIHKEIEQFKCKICHVQFPTQPYLKRHKKTHINQRNSDSDGEVESPADSDV